MCQKVGTSTNELSRTCLTVKEIDDNIIQSLNLKMAPTLRKRSQDDKTPGNGNEPTSKDGSNTKRKRDGKPSVGGKATKKQKENLVLKGQDVKPKRTQKANGKTSFIFENNTQLYSTFGLEDLAPEDFEYLVKHIKNSFYYKEKSVAAGVHVYKSLSNTEKKLNVRTFRDELKKKNKNRVWYKAKYFDEDTRKIEECDLLVEETFLLDNMFASTSQKVNYDEKRLSIPHFRYENNPQCENKGFVKIMKKIREKVIAQARQFDKGFRKVICNIIVSLPDGQEQSIHIDDVRDHPKDDMLSCIVAIDEDTALNFGNSSGTKRIVKKHMQRGMGFIFSGQSRHGGCSYKKMNIRLHFYILKSDEDDTWNVFSGNLREAHQNCKFCGEKWSVTSTRLRKNFYMHEIRCPSNPDRKTVEKKSDKTINVDSTEASHCNESEEKCTLTSNGVDYDRLLQCFEMLYVHMDEYSPRPDFGLSVNKFLDIKFGKRESMDDKVVKELANNLNNVVSTLLKEKMFPPIIAKGLKRPVWALDKGNPIYLLIWEIHYFVTRQMIFPVDRLLKYTYNDLDECDLNSIRDLYEDLGEEKKVWGDSINIDYMATAESVCKRVKWLYPERYVPFVDGTKRLYFDVGEALSTVGNMSAKKRFIENKPLILGTGLVLKDFTDKTVLVTREKK